MKKHCLILNPTAQSRRAPGRWANIFKLLDQAQINYTVKESKYAGHSVVLAEEAASSGEFDVIVAVGGDGTINEVLTGIMKADQLVAKLPAMAIIYTGTSPDICKYHQIPLDHEAAINILKKGEIKKIDIGEVQYHKQFDGPQITGWFLCSVNLGIGASVASGSNSGLRKIFGDLVGTFLSILWSIIKYTHADLSLKVDGVPKISPKTLNLTIGKNPLIASGVMVDVDILPDDGKMYVASINKMGLLGILRHARRIYNGSLYHIGENQLYLANEVSCEHHPNAPEVEFDGDPQGFLPCKVKILKQKLGLIK